jgi:amino acid adenylation domain-containing protein
MNQQAQRLSSLRIQEVYPWVILPGEPGAQVVLAREMHILAPNVNGSGHMVDAEQGYALERTIAEWNRTEADYPRHVCVHQLIDAQAQQTPNALAVEFGGRSLTYSELNTRANQLAHLLRQRGVLRETLVGICVERSLEMTVALLGILKAGGAYVPLDPAYPRDRIQHVLEDAHVQLLITHKDLLQQLPTSAETICLDPEWKALAGQSGEPLTTDVSEENLAYVIYTSGSTGKPKGVQLEHRSVVNFLCSMRREPGFQQDDVLVAVTTLSFDIAGLEMYLPLISGGRIVIAPREATYDGRLLSELIDKSKATVVQATPATWRLLFESGWRGDRNLKVLVGGEALPAELAHELVERCGAVWNMYGPTETTIWSSAYRVQASEGSILPIGRPIANTTFYILDEARQPVAVGSEGELYIGGEGLARGYFERPELTAERFVADPFSAQPKARMYRTGDLARFREDGNVEYLGRLDHQVKIRGFRIELGEIEAVLDQHPEILRSVVVAREESSGDKRLIAYTVSSATSDVTSAELREHARKQLPDYMIPAAIVQLATLPLTPNGKVDRKALPAPKATDFASDVNYVAPRDPVESKLATLWEETLGIRPIGVRTSFFDLGGRSLLAARLFTKISRAFGRDLPLATLFRAPTIEQLAGELHDTSAPAYTSLVAIQAGGSKTPFFCVHGGAGSTLFLHRISREMGPDQPFYGLEPEGLDGRRVHRTTVEQMAAHYLSQIRKVQPVGPYFLGGYCFGGLVAFEMARQLQNGGEQAALVAMFSAPLRFHRLAPAHTSKPEVGRAPGVRRTKLSSIGDGLRWRYRSLTRSLRSRLHISTCKLFLALGVPIPQTLRTMYVVRMINATESIYAPKLYPGTVTLFRGRGLYEDDPNMGWEGLARTLEVCEVGDGGLRSRRDIMNEPLVGMLAKQLDASIAKANTGSNEIAADGSRAAAAGPRGRTGK